MRRSIVGFALLISALALVVSPVSAQRAADADPVVRGVLFFSPTCIHCELVIAEHLPGIFERAGGPPALSYDEAGLPDDVAFYLMSNGSFELLLVDVSVEAGARLFVRETRRLGVLGPGVPRLDIGDRYLTGSTEIPDRLPGIIEAGLVSGGIAWPEVAGISAALESASSSRAGAAAAIGTSDDPSEALATSQTPSVFDRIGNDPVANGLSVLVLVGLVLSLALVPMLVRRGSLDRVPAWPIPMLALIGLGVSAYLASIEISGTTAVCGPVGDCNAVQRSEYARILGVPVGVLGVIAYAIVLVAWLVWRLARRRAAAVATIMVAGMALGGTLFSTYLTFLEPFVIGATCVWCLASAVTTVALFWVTAGAGWAALGRAGSNRAPMSP